MLQDSYLDTKLSDVSLPQNDMLLRLFQGLFIEDSQKSLP